ncbi:rho GTPase-activating protein 19 isoform X2 [Clupea harengus]|uniref:Rho GTPase-activating protein 19 n=1 Tax=Clupea harengus TaxID=7950 RepID=A0A6P8GK18_CLUHA|nr:rho GTPase-activating protein 19 isoform X2 [Clupea harengus]
MFWLAKKPHRETLCSVVNNHDMNTKGQPVIFNPDFFVEKLRHEKPGVFTDLVLSNITRLIDLPGVEFAQLLGEVETKVPISTGFLRSFNFLKRKDKGVIFGAPITEEGIAQIYQLIEYLSKSLHVEGLFRVPGNSIRQQALREMLNNGADIDLETGDYHPNDVATVLKVFLGELPEPLLTQRHFHAHLKIVELTILDEGGNKSSTPDKERQIQALQLLLMLLPPANRSLLKLLLDLLYQTAKHQDKNKMSASNLALMFAPHIIWPKRVHANDLKENINKLNDSITFLIKHSQKLFRAPTYVRELARMHFVGSKSKDDMDLGGCIPHLSVTVVPSKRPCVEDSSTGAAPHTQEALRELFNHVSNMPDSAKKKKLIRQFNKQEPSGTPVSTRSSVKKHSRSRTFSGIIKRKVLGSQAAGDKGDRHVSTESPVVLSQGKEKVGSTSFSRACLSPGEQTTIGKLQY